MGGKAQHHGLSKHTEVAGLSQTKTGGQREERNRGRIEKTEVAHKPGVALGLLITGYTQ